jgi:hypothetical protein
MRKSLGRNTGTYGKPDRFYESIKYDPCIWTVYWLVLVNDPSYDHLGDTDREVLDIKRKLFKETWDQTVKPRAGSGHPENIAEAL